MVEELIAAIKSKKGLESLDNEFVKEKIEKIFAADADIKRKFEERKDFAQFSRSQEYKQLLKSVRKELRVVYGVFQEGDREKLLQKFHSTKDKKIITQLLETHTSTRERLPFYDRIYKELSDRIPAPKRIVDLGCGLNPLSFSWMKRHGWKPEITASDISRQDMLFLAKCFEMLGINGRTIALDLTKKYAKLDEFDGDITFLLKLLDSLEETERYISYKIIEHITTPWIVVSFPTKSLGGKKRISTKGRSWFERLLHRKAMEWETFQVENELFYVIKNTTHL